jgi:rhodanese-related sulfurtransferase
VVSAAPAGIDRIMAAAHARAVHEAMRRGAILVDVRPAAQRAESGEIPGAVVIERNVLEWRLDPRSDARLPFADSYDLEVIVTCQEGYTSSLAAASLQYLGLHRATDLAGGFAAWRAAGLPITSSHPPGGPARAAGTPGRRRASAAAR